MPFYDFICEECEENFDLFCTMTEKEENIKNLKCPKCSSVKINEIIGCPSVNFANPVGTDRWNSDSSGHDYRFHHTMDKQGGLRDQRKNAEKHSKVGADPYNKIDDISSGKYFGEVQ